MFNAFRWISVTRAVRGTCERGGFCAGVQAFPGSDQLDISPIRPSLPLPTPVIPSVLSSMRRVDSHAVSYDLDFDSTPFETPCRHSSHEARRVGFLQRGLGRLRKRRAARVSICSKLCPRELRRRCSSPFSTASFCFIRLRCLCCAFRELQIRVDEAKRILFCTKQIYPVSVYPLRTTAALECRVENLNFDSCEIALVRNLRSRDCRQDDVQPDLISAAVSNALTDSSRVNRCYRTNKISKRVEQRE